MKRKLFALVYVFAILFISAEAQKANSKDNAIEAKCVAWRRQLHEHPELCNREFKTAKIIADHLRSLGLEVKEGVAHTGVIGILKGIKPGPVIGLRADMDGLPVTERVDVPFVSKDKSVYNGQAVGVMHAGGMILLWLF